MLRNLLNGLIRLPRWGMIGLVKLYQLAISPFFPSTCRFQPTCSQYAVDAFQKYGLVKGVILTAYRLGRCHPWGGHGYDPPRWFGEPPPEDALPSSESFSRPSSDASSESSASPHA